MRDKTAKPGAAREDDASEAIRAYAEYNRILRTWFVAFGVGGPALFLVNDKIAEKLVAVGQLRCVVALFLIGATAQILGALLNKYANWYVYACTVDPTMKGSRRQRFADWLVQQAWIDITIDLTTTVSFAVAAWLLMTVFGKAA